MKFVKCSPEKLQLLEDLIQILEIWDSQPVNLLTFNPISLLLPITSIETALVLGVNETAELNFRQMFVGHLLNAFAILGRNPNIDSAKIEALRARLELTKNYKTYISTQSSWFGSLFLNKPAVPRT